MLVAMVLCVLAALKGCRSLRCRPLRLLGRYRNPRYEKTAWKAGAPVGGEQNGPRSLPLGEQNARAAGTGLELMTDALNVQQKVGCIKLAKLIFRT